MQKASDGRALDFSQRGFSYLWILMIVAFIGIGLVTAAEIYSTSVRRDQEKELLFVGRQMRDAIGRYYESTPGGAKQYPDTLEALLVDPRFPIMRRHLRKLYIDPITGKSDWGLEYLGGRIVGIHSLSEKKPIKKANFELSETGFEGKEKYSEWVFTYPPNLLVQADSRANLVQPQSGNFPNIPLSQER